MPHIFGWIAKYRPKRAAQIEKNRKIWAFSLFSPAEDHGEKRSNSVHHIPH